MRRESLREQLNELPSCIQIHLYTHCGRRDILFTISARVWFDDINSFCQNNSRKVYKQQGKSWPLS